VDAITPATSWKTGRIAWTEETEDVNIYRASLSGDQLPVKLIGSTLRDEHPAYARSGQIAFVSDQSGSREIWLARSDGTDQKRITSFNGPDVGDLQWSPDGHFLAFYGRAENHSDIFVLDCDPASMVCGVPRRVTSGITAEVPGWSANGAFLYFASDRTGRWEVWKQARSGGQPVQVTRNGGYAARESPDGEWLYYSKDRNGSIWRIPAGRLSRQAVFSEELVIGPPNYVQQKGWALMSHGIVFMDAPGNGHSVTLRVYDFSGKQIRTIVPMIEGFRGSRDFGVSVSPDSRWVLYPQLDRSGGNIMLAESNK
jgi:Tol biopolymer transport system component